VAGVLISSRVPGAGWLLAGQATYLGAQWVMLAISARQGGVAMAGQYALGLAVTTPVFLLFSLRLRGVLATDARDEFGFETYWLLRVTTTLAAVGAVLVIGAVGPYSSHILLILALTSLTKAVESFSDLSYGLLQRDPDQLRRVGVSHFIRGIVGALAFAAGAWISGLSAALFALAIAWLVVLVGFDLPGTRRMLTRLGRAGSCLPASWNPLGSVAARRLFWATLPLGATAALAAFSSTFPRYVIERAGGEEALGVFACVASIALAGTVMMNVFGESAIARLAVHAAAGDRPRFMRILWHLVWLAVVAGLVGVGGAHWWGAAVLELFYGADYASHADLLVVLMVAAALLYVASFLGYAIMALRAFRAVLWVLVMSTAGSAAACLWLIPRDGLAGAAWAMVWAALLQVVASACALAVLAARIKSPAHA
jgi:O-antigen/teichoic acid export membrane protein